MRLTLEVNTRFIVRAVGGITILLSVFLTWLSKPISWRGEQMPNIDLSLKEMVEDWALEAFSLGMPLYFYAFIFITLALVVVGGVISFIHPVGGVPALIGVGYYLVTMNTQVRFVSWEIETGIGVFIAIFGAVVVIATAIPQLLRFAKEKWD